jgi:hypothetical protein
MSPFPSHFSSTKGRRRKAQRSSTWFCWAYLCCRQLPTASRGGFLGLLAVGSFCWFYSPRKVWSLVLLTGVLLLVLVAAPQEYWDRMRTITDDSTMESGTAGQRMFTWGIGWEMFLANPVFGVGQGNFPWTIGEYLGGRTWQTKSLAGRQAHSLYFTLLPELGLSGGIYFWKHGGVSTTRLSGTATGWVWDDTWLIGTKLSQLMPIWKRQHGSGTPFWGLSWRTSLPAHLSRRCTTLPSGS